MRMSIYRIRYDRHTGAEVDDGPWVAYFSTPEEGYVRREFDCEDEAHSWLSSVVDPKVLERSIDIDRNAAVVAAQGGGIVGDGPH